MNDKQDKETVVISSIVVRVHPDNVQAAGEAIDSLPGASIVKDHDHAFAVVLETESTELAAALTEDIRSIEGVTSVELVAHFFEEETLGDA